MQESQTVNAEQDERVDVESFVEVGQNLNISDSSGFARLKSCDAVENPPSGLPEDYKDEFSSFTYDKYLVFDAEIVSTGNRDIKVVLPARKGHSELAVAYEWSDSRGISDLAGSVIPVRHKAGDSYRVEDFDGLLSGMFSVSTLSSLVDRGVFEHSSGNWGLSGSISSGFRICLFGFLATVSGYLTLTGGASLTLATMFFSLVTLFLVSTSLKKR